MFLFVVFIYFITLFGGTISSKLSKYSTFSDFFFHCYKYKTSDFHHQQNNPVDLKHLLNFSSLF